MIHGMPISPMCSPDLAMSAFAPSLQSLDVLSDNTNPP